MPNLSYHNNMTRNKYDCINRQRKAVIEALRQTGEPITHGVTVAYALLRCLSRELLLATKNVIAEVYVMCLCMCTHMCVCIYVCARPLCECACMFVNIICIFNHISTPVID